MSSTKSEPRTLYIPLSFWFTEDEQLALPTCCLPFGNRFLRSRDIGRAIDIYHSNTNNCAICLDLYQTDTCLKLNVCSHIFHKKCIQSLIDSSQK